MRAAVPAALTVGSLGAYLQRIGFDSPLSLPEGLTFHHRTTEVVIVLPVRAETETVHPADLLSAWTRLDRWGLAADADLQLLRRGRLPNAV